MWSRADIPREAKLAKRMQDAPRLFGMSHVKPADSLFARLLGTEAEPTGQEPVRSRAPRRLGRAELASVDPPAILLRALESLPQGCRSLLWRLSPVTSLACDA